MKVAIVFDSLCHVISTTRQVILIIYDELKENRYKWYFSNRSGYYEGVVQLST